MTTKDFTYTGQFKNEKFHFFGKLELNDGTIYEGNFYLGTKTGVGILKTKLFEYEGHF